MAYDYGLVEIPPASNGHISDFTGAWTIQTGIRWGSGAHVYLVGYPQLGFWATARGFYGRGQYACDGTYANQYDPIGSGYELWAACTMNRGASGGPWFVRLNNGAWAIGSVTSQCFGVDMSPTNYCNPYAEYLRGPYLDGRFLQFWTNVQSQLRYR